jgi:hypothetical protein
MSTNAEYKEAFADLERACTAVRAATEKLAVAATDDIDDTESLSTFLACREQLIAALAAAPEMRDLFIVPALRSR